MFAAALLDAFPERETEALALVPAVTGGLARATIARHPVGGLAGARLVIETVEQNAHRHLRDVRAMLEDCAALQLAATAIAVDIFTRLAEAEAQVHGSTVEAVHFHEVGALDSIADIALAGFLIDATGAVTWSCGALPLGGGTLRTAHGIMPVPAPATARLMQGFEIVDDGLAGERVTPTGAAILAHIRPRMVPRRPSARLAGSGTGFGTRTLPDRPNALRVLVLEGAEGSAGEVAVTRFEIDDQTPEDLATGLDALRAVPGVLDVLQIPAFGKKGRMAVSVQVLAEPRAQEAVRAAVFAQTATLGLREQVVTRRVLAREADIRDGVRRKIARRGDAETVKAEADDIARAGTFAERKALRSRVESDA
jgi:uncharacterized protein (TIGR00299 family) protein